MSTEVKILGKAYTVRSGFDDSFANESADLVNSKMRELIGKAGSLSTEKIAILTAMNLAGELLQERRQAARIRDTIQKRGNRILKLVDAQL